MAQTTFDIPIYSACAQQFQIVFQNNIQQSEAQARTRLRKLSTTSKRIPSIACHYHLESRTDPKCVGKRKTHSRKGIQLIRLF